MKGGLTMAESDPTEQQWRETSVLHHFPVLGTSEFLELLKPLMTDSEVPLAAAKMLASSAAELRAGRAAQGKRAALALANAASTLELRAMRHELVARLMRAAALASAELLRELPEGPALLERLESEIAKARREMAIAVPGNETTH
jgi:hypothetical protein